MPRLRPRLAGGDAAERRMVARSAWRAHHADRGGPGPTREPTPRPVKTLGSRAPRTSILLKVAVEAIDSLAQSRGKIVKPAQQLDGRPQNTHDDNRTNRAQVERTFEELQAAFTSIVLPLGDFGRRHERGSADPIDWAPQKGRQDFTARAPAPTRIQPAEHEGRGDLNTEHPVPPP